jgi:transcriptional regulator with XRE-family HTH domain
LSSTFFGKSEIIMNNFEFSDRIKAILKELGLSQVALAGKLGVSQGIISEFTSGSRLPSKDFIFGLSKLGISIDWFLTGKGGMLLASLPLKVEHGLARTEDGFKVPLLRQKVSCGVGMHWEAEQNIQGYIDIFDMIPRLQIKRLFALCAVGSSMLGAGICDGDYVFFDGEADNLPHDGIYVFALDGDVYCKRLEFEKITKKIKIFSVRTADLEKAELLTTLDMEDTSVADRLEIFGRVVYWVHSNLEE